jgi:hypothetical protein
MTTVAGALAIFVVGPRKMREALIHLHGKIEMKEIEVDEP